MAIEIKFHRLIRIKGVWGRPEYRPPLVTVYLSALTREIY